MGNRAHQTASQDDTTRNTQETFESPLTPWVGRYHADVQFYNFPNPEDNVRNMINGRDDWIVPIERPPITVTAVVDNIADRTKIERLIAPYLGISATFFAPLF